MASTSTPRATNSFECTGGRDDRWLVAVVVVVVVVVLFHDPDQANGDLHICALRFDSNSPKMPISRPFLFHPSPLTLCLIYILKF